MRLAVALLTALLGSSAAQVQVAGEPREMLAAHNAVRAKVGVPPLEWSDSLARYAAEWAEKLVRTGEFRHRDQNKYGENLFTITGGAAAPRSVVRNWASEARNYDYRANRCRGVCGHYTQIVWRDTQRVGCAVARGRGREVWVCNYDPPGNWRGERPY
jgi:pathogenesis-related protein 1